MGATPQECMAKLDRLAVELDQHSADLAAVERKLEPTEDAYDDCYDAFVAALFDETDGKRLPGEDVRRALVNQKLKQINPELLGRYRQLTKSRDRLKRRIETVAKSASAQQSILKALREEMGALR